MPYPPPDAIYGIHPIGHPFNDMTIEQRKEWVRQHPKPVVEYKIDWGLLVRLMVLGFVIGSVFGAAALNALLIHLGL